MAHELVLEVKKDEDQEIAVASSIGIVATTVLSCGVPDLDVIGYGWYLLRHGSRVLDKRNST